jgi:hypothetical protein
LAPTFWVHPGHLISWSRSTTSLLRSLPSDLCVSLYVFVCMSLPMCLGWMIICIHPNWFQGFIEFLSCDHNPFCWNSTATCVIFILVQFKRCGISCIFNLQVPGEHANCGPGVKNSSGFSYTPEILMQNNCV